MPRPSTPPPPSPEDDDQEDQTRAGARRPTPARARLCALIGRLSEAQVEALLAFLEEYFKESGLRAAAGAPALLHAPTGPVGAPGPAPRGDASRPPSEDAPYTLSVPQAARLLSISESHMWTLIRQGRVPALRLGRRVLISRTAIERLAASGDMSPRR